MPISVTTTEGRHAVQYPFPPDALPIELYFKIVFDTSKVGATWCVKTLEVLERFRLDSTTERLQRVVVWGPAAPETGWETTGPGNVFVSELALRIVRASGEVRVPGAEPVSLSQLEYNLKMYVGSAADERAYRMIRAD